MVRSRCGGWTENGNIMALQPQLATKPKRTKVPLMPEDLRDIPAARQKPVLQLLITSFCPDTVGTYFSFKTQSAATSSRELALTTVPTPFSTMTK
jgi:hypothetical protein